MPEDATGQPERPRKRSHRKNEPLSFFKNNVFASAFVIVVILIVLLFSSSTDQFFAKIFGLMGKRPELRVQMELDPKGTPVLRLHNQGPQKLISLKTLVHSFSFPSNETDAANYLGPDPAGQILTFATNQMNLGAQASLSVVGLIDDRVVYVIRSTYFHEHEKRELSQEDVFLWKRAQRQILSTDQFKSDPDFSDMMRSIKSHWGRIPAPPEGIRP
jgi:hypothetical protein